MEIIGVLGFVLCLLVFVLWLFSYKSNESRRKPPPNRVSPISNDNALSELPDHVTDGFGRLNTQIESAFEASPSFFSSQISKLEIKITELRRSNEQSALAMALLELGIMYYDEGLFARSRSSIEESLSIARLTNLSVIVTSALNTLAMVANEEGDLPTAFQLCIESCHTDLDLNQEPLVQLRLLSVIYQKQGRLHEALQILELVKQSHLARHELWSLGKCLNELGLVAIEAGDEQKAAKHLVNSYLIKKIVGDSKGVDASLNNMRILFGRFPNVAEEQKVVDILSQAGGFPKNDFA